MTSRAWVGLLWVVVLASTLGEGVARRPDPVQKPFEPTLAIPTPCIPWAKPLAAGPLKVLFVMPWNNQREALELAQRLEMSYRIIPLDQEQTLNWSTDSYFPDQPTVGSQRNKILAALDEPWDILVIGGVEFSLFGSEAAAKLVQRIESGMGLLYVSPAVSDPKQKLPSFLPLVNEAETNWAPSGPWSLARDHFISSGLAYDAMPRAGAYHYRATGETIVHANGGDKVLPMAVVSQAGAGRVVCLSYCGVYNINNVMGGGLTPFMTDPESLGAAGDYWEHYYQLLARSVVWAGRHEGPIRVLAAEASGERGQFRLTNQGGTIPGCKAEFTLRSNDGGAHIAHTTQRVELPGGDSVLAAPLPTNLPTGRYLFDLIVRDGKGRSLAWATATFVARQPTWIEKVVLPDAVPASAAIPVKVQLGGAPPPDGTSLTLELWDTYDRLLRRQSFPVSAMELTTSFDPPPAVSRIHRLRAELRQGKTILSTQQAECVRTPKRKPWDTYQTIVWDGSLSEVGTRAYLLRNGIYPTLRQYGATALCNVHRWYVPEEYRLQVEMNFEPVIFGLHLEHGWGAPEAQVNYEKTGDIKHLYRNNTLTDPAYLDKTRQEVHKIADLYARYTPLGYCVGDELNATSYNAPSDIDFSPVALATFRTWLRERYANLDALNQQWGTTFSDWNQVVPETSAPARARADGNYSSWEDHRSFMEWSFAHIFAQVRKNLYEKDPDAPIGISGTQATEAYGGFDHSILDPQFDFFFAYSHKNLGDIQRSFVRPGAQMSESLGYYTHNPAQEHCVWQAAFWGWFHHYYWMTALLVLPDFRPSLTLVELEKDTRDLRLGLADVLMTTKRLHDGVALHYSMASVHTAWITGQADAFAASRNAWIHLLDETGFSFHHVSSTQMAGGALKRDGYRVLILPYSLAIGDDEVAAIRQFTREGGTVIADVEPGLYDGHGRRRGRGALSDLFGTANARLSGTNWLTNYVSDPAYGKGVSDLDNTIDSKAAGRVQALHQEFTSWMKQAGVYTPIPLKAAEPGPLFYTRTVRFMEGDALYVGIRRHWGYNYAKFTDSAGKNDDRTRHITATLPATTHLYDARSHSYLGLTEKAEFDLTSAGAKFFALWPYQLKGIKLDGSRARLGESVDLTCKLDTGGAPPVRHVIRFEVRDAAGRERPEYATRVRTDTGSATWRFPLALNDPLGDWKVTATEVISGKSASSTLLVKR